MMMMMMSLIFHVGFHVNIKRSVLKFVSLKEALWVASCVTSRLTLAHPSTWLCSPLRDGIPYCEMDYHAMFGIQCENCKKYITGKVLEVEQLSPVCLVEALFTLRDFIVTRGETLSQYGRVWTASSTAEEIP